MTKRLTGLAERLARTDNEGMFKSFTAAARAPWGCNLVASGLRVAMLFLWQFVWQFLWLFAMLALPLAAQAADVLVSSLTDNPDPATRGGNISFTITAENSAADTASNVVVTYPLPANTQFVSVTDAAVPGACVHNGATPGIVTCSYAALLGTQAAPAGPVRTIVVVLKTTGASVTTLSSTVTITSDDADANPSNNTLSQNTTINDGADLSAALAGSPNPATGGGLVAWTVTGSNAGPNTSGPISFVTTLPGVLTYVSASGTGWSCGTAGQVVTCTRAALGVAAYPTLTINARITGVSSGTVTLSGSIGSSVADPLLANNSTVASVSVNPGTDLAVTQNAIAPNPVSAGNNATFVLRPVNNGPDVASAGANVTLPLPAGFVYVSGSGSSGWTCAAAGSPVTVTCTYAGSWATGNTGTLTIVATAPSVGSTTAFNNITATIAPNAGGPADPNAANDSAARNLTVSPDGVDLSVTKNKTPTIVAQGANMTSTLVVANAGPRNAASGTITLVDALDPTKESYVSASGTNWACVSAAPNVNCTYNAVLNSGASASTLTIVTQALAAGTATNNATTSYAGTPGDYNAANDTIGASVTVSAVPNSPDLKVTLGASTAGGVQTTLEYDESVITYAVVLTNQNSTAADAQNVVVTLSVPGRTTSTPVTLVSTVLTNTSGASNATFSCSGTGTGTTGNVSCTQTGGTLLKPGDVVTFTISATRPMNDGSFTATATANSSSQGDPVPADNTAMLAVQIDPIADVEVVSKVLAANPVLAGVNAIYTITVRNNGPSTVPANGLSMTDVFTIPGGDAGFTFISATTTNGSCTGLTANTSYAAGPQTVTCVWTTATTSGTSRTVTVTVRPNWQSGAGARTLANTATVLSTVPQDSANGAGSAADSKSLTLNINPAQVDLLINNTDTPDPLGYDPGTPTNNDITYIVATTNNGPSLASGTGFTFTMTPPAGKTITFRGDGAASTVAATNPSGNIAGSVCDNVGSSVTGASTLTVTCTFASGGLMAAAATVNRYLVFRAGSAPNAGGDTYTTNATVFRNETDSNASNDSEGETTTVRVRSDLSVTKTPSVNPAQIRQPFNWSIVVSNAGPGDSQTTGLTDTLPAGMAYTGTPTFAISGGGATGNCAVVAQAMTCAFGTLPANQTATVTVPAKMTAYPAGGTIQNCATASTSEIDPNSVNNLNVCSTLTVQRSSIAGTVFQDRDRSGGNAGTPQSTAIDPRIQNVAIALTGTDAYGNAVNLAATTDAAGAYGFTDLSPADATGYTITETQPAAYVNGPAAPPSFTEGGTYAAGGAGNSTFTAIPLAGNRSGTGYDFPEVRKPDLTGFVYIDVNLNGVRNAGTDTAINGATVRLLNAGTLAVVATTTTNASGVYTFSAVDPLIVYTLEQPLPATPSNLSNGPVNAGLIGGAACASGCTVQADTPGAGTDRIAAIDLGAGTDGTAFNFGEIAVTAISGTVYIDRNRDGLMDATPTDARLSGVTLTLVSGTTCAGAVVATTTTDALGAWSFATASVGATYTVCETQPTGYGEGSINPGTSGASNAANAITITTLPSGGSANNNFGERVGQLAGSVYVDYNAGTPASYDNGVRDAGEAGIGGITVTLSGTDVLGAAVSRTATTDGSGNYVFADLIQPNGSGYTLSEGTVGAGYVDGKDTAGTAGGNASVNDVIGAIALAPGAQGTGYVFGELPSAAIAGTVYIDRNRSDTLDATPTDGRIANVTVRLLRGADCSTGTLLLTTTTDINGGYAFASLAAGAAYLVCETQPAGYANGIENPGSGATTPAANTIAIASLSASGSTANDFGERVGSIAGSVYVDYTAGNAALSNNGVRDGGEAGLVGVTVTLTGSDAAGHAVNLSTTTDASGNYAFADVLQANGSGYTLTEGAVAGAYVDGKDSAGTAGGNATAVNDSISGIALGAGVQATGYLFGELPNATIAGTVYVDRNRNNTIDATPTDARIAGVTIRLVQGADCATGTLLQTTTTNASGAYAFSGLASGSAFLVCETQPAGYANGSENPGTGATSTAANAIAIAALSNGGSTGNDFGERIGAIAGSVYVDFSPATPAQTNNGVRDAGETGLAGVTVTLTGNDRSGAPVSRTATTDGNGNYRFDDLLQSDATGYTLAEGAIPPAAGRFNDGKDTAGSAAGSNAVNDRLSGIVLGAGVVATDYVFGELPIAPITGTVYVDRNRDGVMDAAPADGRIAGVSIAIYAGSACSGTAVATARTDSSGNYDISGASVGLNYAVCEAQPAGYAEGTTHPGTAGTSSAPNVVLITALPATGSAGNNFGERIGSLAGSVYIDFNAATPASFDNGIRDAGEPGVAAVTVTLSGRDAAGASVNRSATTDGNGNYRFDDVTGADASGYTLTEGAVPAGLQDGKDTAGSAGGSTAVNDAIGAIVLGAGVQATGYNFGELQNASVTGTVYVDRNRNNAIDATPTDARLAGVTIRLVQGAAGATCSSGPTLQTTTTSASGSYAFNGLSGGAAYLVCETQPAGYADGIANPGTGATATLANSIAIASLPAGGSAGNDFGERVGAIAGAVYIDFDPAAPAGFDNGIRDAGEPGVAGVVVTLSGRDASGAAIQRTATTDANGNYRFDDLLAADGAGYTLTEGTVPSYLGDGKDSAGSAGGSTAVNDSIAAIALGAGVQATGYNFGELPNAPLSGTVYADRNRNNTLDATPTDGRIAGVIIRLLQGADCATGTLVKSTTTSATGTYGFSGLSAGAAYLVCEVQPAGWLNGAENPGTGGISTAANSIAIASLPGGGSTGNDFAERSGSLAGSVYIDYSVGNPALTNNGVRDAGEAGVAGVPITLTGRDVNGGNVNLSTVTDGNGNYRFDDLLQSDTSGYTVVEGALPAQAAALIDGRDSAGSAGGNNAVNDRLQAIVLGSGVQATDYVFGELPNASIGGTVFIDRNRNGVNDPAPTDGRIAGVAVRLLLGSDCSSGSSLQSTSTDAAGAYTFTGVAAGASYVVCETQPAGYGNGVELPAAGATRIGVNAIGIANLSSSGSFGNDFGERLGSLAGSVFLDANNDGTRAAAEAGIAGVTVTLSGTDALGNAISKTATTDVSGNYRFDDLLASTGYRLTQQTAQPVVNNITTLNGRSTAGSSGGTASGVAATPSTLSAIALAAGVDAVNYLFAEILPVSVSGAVFSDMDDNGQRNLPADAGIANVAIALTGTDDNGSAVKLDTRTGADGSFAFTALRPGTYTLTEPTQPDGTSNGASLAGSAGGAASSRATLPSAISAIPLAMPGTASIDNLFAEVPSNAVIRGRVWLDANNNGLIDGSEAGIANVAIELGGTTAGGLAVTRTARTDATGAFAFENLAPGTYALREPQQPAGTLNGLTIAGSTGGTATTPAVGVSAITAIPLASGQTSSAHHFAELPPADIAGRVFGDDNDDGRFDGGETGMAGVPLTLTGSDDLGNVTARSVTSADDGTYSFANLRPGTYTVTEPTQPAGTLNGITTAGSLGGTATPIGTLPSAVSAIVMPTGGHSTGNDFAELAHSPDLQVGKTHVEPRFTVNNPGTYRITVRNAGQAPTVGEYTVTDRLPAGLTLSTIPSGTGWTCTGATGAAGFSCTSSAVLAPGASAAVITAVVRVDAAAAKASPVNNAVLVEGGGELDMRRPTVAEREAFAGDTRKLPACGTSAAANGCGDSTVVQLAAALSGTVWYDIGSAGSVLDGGDRRLKDWQVEVSHAATGEIVGRATTGTDGSYRIVDLVPGLPLAVRFREPQSSVVFGYPVNGDTAPGSSGVGCNEATAAANGSASSCVTRSTNPQLTVVLAAGQELTQQSLPVDPSGIVYDSGSRDPVPGAVVTLTPAGTCAGWNPATQIVGASLGGYRIEGTSIAMTVGQDGLYQFLFASNAPAACAFTLNVAPPAGFTFQSKLIAPSAGTLSAPGGPSTTFKVQPQTGAPTAAIGPGTVYWLSLNSGSASASIIHNHIPVDAAAPTGLTLAKTGDKTEAEVGDTVRYGITVRLTSGALPRQVTVIDRLPAGFTYIKGTAVVDGKRIADPSGMPGPTLAFNLGAMPAAAQVLLQYRVRVDIGSQQGDGVNRARAYGCTVPGGCVAADRSTPLTGSVATNEGQFKVRVMGGVFTTEACVAGKIFIDCNGNHVQDREELGIPGVRLIFQDGTTLISDAEGKYSACGLPPKSHVLKVDTSTLPKGSQLTTSSNRNLGDAGSLWIDLKNGELHRADFIEGSCAAPVLDQVKARRGQGEVRAPDAATPKNPALRFDSRPPPKPPSADPPKPQPGASNGDAVIKTEGGAHATR